MFENPSLNDSSLYLKAPIVGSGFSVAPLIVKTKAATIGEFGGFVESGAIPLLLNGNNDANVFTSFNQTASLTVKSEYIESGVSPLFIQRSFANSTDLFIDSRIASGVSDFYVDGANISNSGINLIIKTLESDNLNIFTRGFFD
jgi:hypothetical protein